MLDSFKKWAILWKKTLLFCDESSYSVRSWTKHFDLYVLSGLMLQQLSNVGTIIISILLMIQIC